MNTSTSTHPGLRLYIAKATPNSERAVTNLRAALAEFGERSRALGLEVVDVFTQPRRAINDGVIVTPTLIGLREEARLVMIGDLTDTPKLHSLLYEMTAGQDRAPLSECLADTAAMAS
jgi:circadian clock protein KaiB